MTDSTRSIAREAWKMWMRFIKSSVASALMVAIAVVFLGPVGARADTAAEIDRDVDNALEKLYAVSPAAVKLSTVAKGILVFPDIIKGGFMIGAQYGVGALLIDGSTQGYYKTTAASYGLQVGAQSFGYVMFFMTEDALAYLEESDGWEIGVGPSLVVVDEGMARTLTTSTTKEDIYAFIFGQKGLMAGLGIQGSKITEIFPERGKP